MRGIKCLTKRKEDEKCFGVRDKGTGARQEGDEFGLLHKKAGNKSKTLTTAHHMEGAQSGGT